jgi:hypothetical protein
METRPEDLAGVPGRERTPLRGAWRASPEAGAHLRVRSCFGGSGTFPRCRFPRCISLTGRAPIVAGPFAVGTTKARAARTVRTRRHRCVARHRGPSPASRTDGSRTARADPYRTESGRPAPPPGRPGRLRGRAGDRKAPRGPGNDQEAGPGTTKGPVVDGALASAVAEGFEPSVTCATLAFEASSFGRSDTLPRETLQHGGLCSEIGIQRLRKKSVSKAAHSAASTPSITSGRWLSRRSRTTSQSDPAAPAFSSRAP